MYYNYLIYANYYDFFFLFLRNIMSSGIRMKSSEEVRHSEIRKKDKQKSHNTKDMVDEVCMRTADG